MPNDLAVAACSGRVIATHATFMPGVKVQNRVWTWLTTVDHKRIGILYGTTSFVFFLLAGLESLLMRVQLARPDSTLIGPQAYNELFKTTRTGTPAGRDPWDSRTLEWSTASPWSTTTSRTATT